MGYLLLLAAIVAAVLFFCLTGRPASPGGT